MVLRSSLENKTNFSNCMCYSSSPHSIKKILSGRFAEALYSTWNKQKCFLTEQRLVSMEISQPLFLIILSCSSHLISRFGFAFLSVSSRWNEMAPSSYIIISLCRPFMMVCRTQCCANSVRAHCDDCRVNRKSCDFFAVCVEVTLIFKSTISLRISIFKQSRCRLLTSRYIFASQCKNKQRQLQFICK